jgi:hypothetical protein
MPYQKERLDLLYPEAHTYTLLKPEMDCTNTPSAEHRSGV